MSPWFHHVINVSGLIYIRTSCLISGSLKCIHPSRVYVICGGISCTAYLVGKDIGGFFRILSRVFDYIVKIIIRYNYVCMYR